MTMTVDPDAIASDALRTPYVYLSDADAASVAATWGKWIERLSLPALAALVDGGDYRRASVARDLDHLMAAGNADEPTLQALKEWADMDPEQVHAVSYVYGLDGRIYDGPYPEVDADACTVFYADSTRLVDVVRAPRGGWRLASSASDYLTWPVSVHDRARFATVDDAVADACKRGGDTIRRVGDWLDD